MELLQKWRQQLPTLNKTLVASLSLISGLLLARVVVQKRLGHSGTRKEKSAAEDTAALSTALGLKGVFSRRLAELADFKDRVGHANVPLGSASSSALIPAGLGKWVYAQRKKKMYGTIKPAEEAALTALGLHWTLDPDELDDSEMIEQLLAYKAQFGDMLVPKKYEADPLLGAWVAAIRRKSDPLLNGGESVLDPELRKQLDDIGFPWEPAKRCGSAFMTGFRIYGEAKASGKPVPDEQWCEDQREARRQGKLSEQRISYLDKFNFDWEAGEQVC